MYVFIYVSKYVSHKHLCFRVWISDTKWNVFDSIAIIIYFIAFAMRFSPPMVTYTHAIYATGVCYWYIRSLKLIGTHHF